MADYYPLIARAVAALDPSASGESRRALYERARTALITQLRGVEPALSEAEITRERLALEEAVRKVEAEWAQRPRREASRAAAPPAVPSQAGSHSESSHPPVPDRPPPPESPARDPLPREGAPHGNEPHGSEPHHGPPREGAAHDGPRRGDALRESARSAAARMAQAEARSARASQEARPDATRQDAKQDTKRDTKQDTWDDVSRARDVKVGPPHGAGAGGTRGFRDVVADADDLGRAAAQANRAARRTYANVPSPSPEFERIEPDMEQRGDPSPQGHDEAAPAAGAPRPASPARSRDGAPGKPVKVKAGGFPLKSALAVGAVLIAIGGAILLYQNGSSLRALFAPAAPVAEAPVSGEPGIRPKITDRVGQTGPSSQPIAPVAQRAILYEEDPADPQGRQTVGSVVWRLDQIAPSPKQKPDTAIRADVDLPDRKVKVAFTLMRNTDPSMPATSHTIEVVYTTPPDFGTTIANVPGIYAKSPDQPRGTPLAATSVKVQDGYFLIGLSNVDVDRDRNIQVLKERSSLDIPMVYGNGKRAILSLEKGSPGERAFRDAFEAWGQ